jgi:hypothetical protein
MKRLIFAGILLAAAASLFTPGAEAQLSTSNLTNLLYGFKICIGTYALCAASTCTPTEGTIDVNTASGPVSFPAATCACPVYKGPAIADPNGGNMQGSCDPPGPGQIWSLYNPKSNIPQAINNWSRKPADTAVSFQLCSSSDNDGATYANCFSFACTLDHHRQHGVKTATCTCPLGESLDGGSVDAATAIVTPAGQCNSDICSQHPVALGFPALDSQGDACLGSESNGLLTLH